MLCFYHRGDLDGKCSGAIVKLKYPECRLFGIDYAEPVPWSELEPGEVVFIVDFSFDMPDMRRLNNEFDLIWIDHHKTAMADADEWGLSNIAGHREIGKAGCELTWEYLHESEQMPRAVYLLGRYDVWDHVDDALEFQYGMRLMFADPENVDMWGLLFQQGDCLGILSRGRNVLEYERQLSDGYARDYGMTLEFEGLRFAALNRGNANSLALDAFYDDEEHDAKMLFCCGPRGWKVSLYADKDGVDVSWIAKKYGGGGHAGASGFSCAELPFSLETAVRS